MEFRRVLFRSAEEIFEAKSGGPQVERARGSGLPWRDVMMLAKKCRIIAILTQNLSNACGALWNFRQIPRKARGDINDIACRHSMLIAASEQCSTCGGTNAGDRKSTRLNSSH